MLKYFTFRFLSIIPMLFVVTIIIFIGLQLTPGDPLTYLIPPELLASANFDLASYKKAMGLDAPLYVQFFRWFSGMLQGKLGYSLVDGTSIATMLGHRLPATLELAAAALIISSVLGIVLGLISSVRQNSAADYGNTVIGIIGISIPEFFLGIIAIQIFSIKLGWLPVGGRLDYGESGFLSLLKHVAMPALVLGFSLTAALMRYTRGTMLDVLGKDYVKTARSKGLPEWKVIVKHAFRNALMPVILLLCFRLPMLIGGTVIIESVFGWPGMGGMLLNAVSAKDYPVVMIATMLTAFMVLLASFLVDLLTALLDPRVRFD
ncbi:peptide ABC transporter permease [Gordoniibacillus kamchatkensis]|uniref:Peptide ABC transporter permease n=1 Tax=Gordoniibacillus kamchatkensis TaxID=1590651 RepID=A0ABR5AH14_9BACL|nr:ABC transporter permease [Paenibacillus sp. VKM B-2647]KIL40348.1 peptide ABC transporter permease [Paenibacillus sp. VKM B-2647]